MRRLGSSVALRARARAGYALLTASRDVGEANVTQVCSLAGWLAGCGACVPCRARPRQTPARAPLAAGQARETDGVTLHDVKFQPGDLIDVAVL